ncbi:MAG: glycogen synthase [Calditrichaeota bacterium]|nr:glycogen synthase [Calditrichota bacterium]
MAPFSKSGGLADVSASLPQALAEIGHDVVVVSPKYKSLRAFSPATGALSTSVKLNHSSFDVSFPEQSPTQPNLRYVFVDSPEMFERDGYYYDPQLKSDYLDNDARFALLSLAALEWCRTSDWVPDIVHGHDWQTGPVPLFMRSPRFDGLFDESRFTLTIHNMAFQGRFHAGSQVWVDHGAEHFHAGGRAEFHGTFCYLKMGIEFADAINTVSPTYAHELRTIDSMGFDMGPVLQGRYKYFSGILNGIDTILWNPQTDDLLDRQFTATSLAARNVNKRALCESAGLPYDQSVPLIGMVTRVSEQKGFGILIPAAGELISWPAQLIILGNGDPHYEQELKMLESVYPKRIKVFSDHNEALAHKIYGSVDIYLMPSHFEPCGLSQMMALRYGAPPVARETGGLADTILDADHDPTSGTGFLFRDYDSRSLVTAMKRALSAFRKTERWRKIQRHGMRQDFSWRRSARVYEEMYRRSLSRGRLVP